MNIQSSTMIHKYHTLGNDYLILDPSRQPAGFSYKVTPAHVIAVCDRHRGVGSDGIVVGPLVGTTPSDHFSCEIWNPDGTQAEVSGNGLRIFARYLLDAGYVKLGGATTSCTLLCGKRNILITYGASIEAAIRVDLGHGYTLSVPNTLPSALLAALGRPTLVDVGNPHCVFFPSVPINKVLARRWGPSVENDPTFPQRTNVQFVRLIDPHTITIEIWERGVGYTQASGSSSCAAALAAIVRGDCLSPVTVRMPGGTLVVDVQSESDASAGGWRVAVTGPVTPVFEGYWRMKTNDEDRVPLRPTA